MLVVVSALIEASAYAAGRYLQSKWGMYRDPLDVDEGRLARDYSHYLELRAPHLGWPYPSEFGSRYTPNGAAPVPANAGLPVAPHVSIYGDSFSWGLINATPEQAWANRLAIELECRVDNFGVKGYGSDQAYLRYLRQTDDDAASVVLAHMSEDITRNLTRLRDLTTGSQQSFAFKPRFTLAPNGELKLIPMPDLSEEEYLRFLAVASPQMTLPHENFHPGGPMGVVRLTFPYSFALVRNLSYWRMQARLEGVPDYVRFYQADHPGQGLQITAAIMKAFAVESRRRSQRPLVILFPGTEDALIAQKSGVSVMAELAELVRAEGVEVIDFTLVLIEYLADRDAREVYADHHFTTEIDPLIAATVAAKLR